MISSRSYSRPVETSTMFRKAVGRLYTSFKINFSNVYNNKRKIVYDRENIRGSLRNKYDLPRLYVKYFSLPSSALPIASRISIGTARICHGNYYEVLRDNPRERDIPSDVKIFPADPVTHHRARGAAGLPHRDSRSPIFLMSEISICHESGTATFRAYPYDNFHERCRSFHAPCNLARDTSRRDTGDSSA